MFDDNKFLKGTSGEVFLNNTKLIEINKINIKMTGQFEDFAPVGDYCTHHIYTGYDGEGTLEGARINTMVDADYSEYHNIPEYNYEYHGAAIGNWYHKVVESYQTGELSAKSMEMLLDIGIDLECTSN